MAPPSSESDELGPAHRPMVAAFPCDSIDRQGGPCRMGDAVMSRGRGVAKHASRDRAAHGPCEVDVLVAPSRPTCRMNGAGDRRTGRAALSCCATMGVDCEVAQRAFKPWVTRAVAIR